MVWSLFPSPLSSATMSQPPTFPDPPTESTLSDARLALQKSLHSLDTVTSQITRAEKALQLIVLEAQCAINDLLKEKSGLEDQVLHTRSYLAPVRRLPTELLREVFYWCFEGHPCVAWLLSAVCRTWRQLALGMHTLWSKVSHVHPAYSLWRSPPGCTHRTPSAQQSEAVPLSALGSFLLPEK